MFDDQNEVEASQQHTTTPFELFDIITEKNHALRAFGALLRSANLSDFDSDSYFKGSKGRFDTENLQDGLSKLIDLYLADQEQAVESFADEYGERDEWMIRDINGLINLAKEGAFLNGHIPTDRFLGALNNLETIIARDQSLRPMAEALKASLMKYSPLQAVRDIDQEGA